MGTRVPYSTDFKDLQKVYDSLIGTVKVAEDFINEALAFNDGKKQAIKEIFEALIGGDFKAFYYSEEFTNDSELIEKLFNMKEEIEQDFVNYA